MTDARSWALFGAASPDVIVAGHSHAYAFVRAAMHPPSTAALSRAVAYSDPVSAGAPIGNAYWQFVEEAAGDRAVAVVWNGNQHTVDLLFERTPPLHVLSEDATGAADDPVPDDAVWAPRAALRAHFAPTVEELDLVLARLSACAAQIIVLGTPAPKARPQVESGLEVDAFVQSMRSSSPDGRPLTVARTALRVTAWQIVQDLLRERAGAHGAVFLPAPARTRAGDGTLLPEYCARDVSHANADYGDTVWPDIESLVHAGGAA